LVIRYVLETCETVAQARATLARLPIHAAQNVTLLDRTGEFVTAFLSPDREPEFREVAVATNHQRQDDWPEYASAVRTLERERYLVELLREPKVTRDHLLQAFLEAPLYSTAFSSGFGTVYTAAYFPAEGVAEYRWPDFTWTQSFDRFVESERTQTFAEGARAA
jgi:predicted choloylglycine hydrolase